MDIERGQFITLSGVRTKVLSLAYQLILDQWKAGTLILTDTLMLDIERDFLDVENQNRFLANGPYNTRSYFSTELPLSNAMRDLARLLYLEQYKGREVSDDSKAPYDFEIELEKVRQKILTYLTSREDRACKKELIRAVRKFIEERDNLVTIYELGEGCNFPAWKILWLYAFSLESYEAHIDSELKRGINVFGYLPMDSIHWELLCGNNSPMKQFFKTVTNALKIWLGTRQLFLEDMTIYLEVPFDVAYSHYQGNLLVESGKTRQDVFAGLLESFRNDFLSSEHHVIIDGNKAPHTVAKAIVDQLCSFSKSGHVGRFAML